MKHLKIIFFLIFSLQQIPVLSLPVCYIEHYSTEDGLPQFSITDIMQDHKGFMWFSTWDGFSKFDGYTFRNFKVRRGDIYQMESNRIQHIYEDHRGNIWLLSYNDEAHCFDPHTETFLEIEALHNDKNKRSFHPTQIKICPSGRIWLTSKNNGCICVADSTLAAEVYNQETDRLKSNKIHRIFEDNEFNSWILTDNGLSLIKNKQREITSFFFENKQSDSNQRFFSAIELSGQIWFGCDKGRIWKYTKANGKFDIFQIPSSSDLTAIEQVSSLELIITTSDDGLFIYNIRTKQFRHYNTATCKKLRSNKIRALFLDSRQQFWFETEGLGIYKLNTKTDEINYYIVDIDDPAIKALPPASDILEDIHGQIWVQPRGGGFSYYNQVTEALEPFYNKEASSEWRFSNILHSLYSDRQGNLWFCTRSHGLEKVTFSNNNFKTIKINADIKSSVANDVRAVLQDKDKRLWVATKDQHLTIYDEQYKLLGYFSDKGRIEETPSFSGVIYSMMQDCEENIWLGSKTNGLFKLKKTSDPYRYQMEHYKKDPNNIYSISDNVVYSIFQDSKKNIWVGTYGGGLNLIRNTKEGKTLFINYKNNLKNYPIKHGSRIRYISENKSGNLCIGTTEGLLMSSLLFPCPDDMKYKHYTRIPGDKESLSSNDIHGILCTQEGDMFLATFGGGINKVTEYNSKGFPLKFESYTMQEGLPSDVCLAILEDDNKQLWVSMENNLMKFNPVTKEFDTFVEIKRLMSTSSFSEASVCKLANNELVFGFSNGILHFSPKEIKNSNFIPRIVLSEFLLYNRIVPIGGKDSPLNKNIDNTDKLVLSHNQHSFSIEFAALDFTSNNIFYAYKLDGFDKDWIYTHQKRVANYTNIPKGNYVFKVKSTNGEGVWAPNERCLPITVLPSFWETPCAFAIYILLFIGFTYMIIRILFTFYRLRKDVEIEKELSDMKLRFFTDISHEIRTPLTMISAPIDYLLMDKDIPEKAKTHLNSISQNANHMLRLVNQILDFRKVSQSRLKVQEINLGESVKSVCNNFQEIAHKHNINFTFHNQADGDKIWAAPDSIEIILMNLLSNAFKYTPNGKAITVSVQENDSQLIIKIKDEGCGISKDKQKKLFVRFASFNEDPSKPSTGIGLSIVKDLMDKHTAKISLESEPGQGSTFTLTFLKGKGHFKDNVEFITSQVARHIKEISENDKEYSILIVEDDSELRTFICNILETEYNIIEAEDGQEGLEKAEKENPDFIVSDIMMPRMDGIELLQRLKENINTSHIPVILLTAKTTIENKLEGLSLGADDYITKPFSVQYFCTKIKNLLEQRKRLQEVYRSQLMSSQNTEVSREHLSITPQNEEFIKKVIEMIETHLEESEFTIDKLSISFNMSRSVFSNKIKSLTGLPPFDLVREVRLKKAAQLLSSGEYMVKEVSYMIGIADTKYFGKIFKAKYGMSPQEYKSKRKTPC